MVRKPTRIIEKPHKVPFEHGMRMGIKCDNGVTYSVLELCDAISISTTLFYKRLRNDGWDSPEMLTAPLLKRKAKFSDYIDSDDGDLTGLSNKRRDYNLARIPAITPLEQKMMADGVL